MTTHIDDVTVASRGLEEHRMNLAPVPQRGVLKSIELFGTEVKPLIGAELKTSTTNTKESAA